MWQKLMEYTEQVFVQHKSFHYRSGVEPSCTKSSRAKWTRHRYMQESRFLHQAKDISQCCESVKIYANTSDINACLSVCGMRKSNAGNRIPLISHDNW